MCGYMFSCECMYVYVYVSIFLYVLTHHTYMLFCQKETFEQILLFF